MAESATRDVVFRMRAEPAQGAIQAAEQFGKRLQDVQKKSFDFSAKLQQQTLADATKKFEQAIQNEVKLREQATRQAKQAVERQAQAEIRERERVVREVDKFLKDSEKEQERIHKRHRQRQRSIALQNRKDRLEEAKQQQAAIQATERKMADASGRLSAGNAMLVEGMTSAGESLVRMATGLATIGLVSEKNNEKLLRGLVLLKGVNDSIAGGINLWVRTGKIVEGYRATLEGVRATQAAINAQQAVAAAASAGGAARGASGAAGGVVAGAAGGAGLTALQRVAVMTGGALGTVKTAAVALAAPLAKLGTVVVGALSIFDMIASGQIAPREGSIRAGAADRLGGPIAGFMGWASSFESDDRLGQAAARGGAFAGAEQNRRKTDRMAAAQAARRELEVQRRTTIGGQLDSASDRAAAALQPFLSAVETSRGQDKFSAIDAAQKQIGIQQSAIQAIGTANDPQLKFEQTQKLIELDQQAVSLAKERQSEEIKILQTKKEQARTAIEASREELANAKQTLSEAKDRVKATKELLLSAEVRFAQMDEKDQRKLLETSKKAQAGGTLDRKERDLLLQSGIGRSREIAERQAVEEAKRLGFREVEGADLRMQLQKDEEIVKRQKEIVKRVENTIKVKEEYVVSLDDNVINLREMVSDEVRREMQRRVQLAQEEAEVNSVQQSRRLRSSLASG